MPVTKLAYLRYQTIDHCLRNRQRIWQEADLLQALSHAHREHTGSDKGISRSTLFTDLKAMKPGGATGFEAPIAHTKDKGYHYTRPGYSISQSPVSAPDVVVLHQALLALRAIRGVGLATALDDIIRRVESRLALTGSTSPIPTALQFEAAPDYTGTQWLQPLYEAIQQRQPLRLAYRSYRAAEASLHIVHPHLLKAYLHRWFLVGHSPTEAGPRVFALDRITGSAPTPLPYVPAAVDFETYFQHVIGPTVPLGEVPTTVHLRFSGGRAPYVHTKPLHRSQCLVAGTAGLELTLHVIPNPELVTQLLSFGADVEVLAPAKLRATMQKRLGAALARYGS
ncbi:hypothetical protein A0257_04500 [Hymenobacter psoromatis]|nr:hypothetical protein A0257_04500 [Hymenobacter psoromatis]